MNWRGVLLSAWGLLLVLGMLWASGPGHASRGTDVFGRTSDVRPQTFQRVAQKRDPDTDPGGLPGARPDRNRDFDSVGQRGRAMERRTISREKSPTRPTKPKTDRTVPDKSQKVPQ
jgi:hypothetical protein